MMSLKADEDRGGVIAAGALVAGESWVKFRVSTATAE